ncbi:MAG: outer membrane protein assembly factor BamD [Pseudomonadota bacterium]
MKKQATLIAICMLVLAACATAPEPKKSGSDEEAYTKAMNSFNHKNYFDAIPAFEELREKFPMSPYAVIAELRLGDSHYAQDQYVEAVHFFENFRRLHPSNHSVPYSIYMTGMCHYQQVLSLDRDQTFAEEAAEQFQQLIELYPKSSYTGRALCKLAESKKRIAEHEFFIGSFYLKKENYKGAIDRFNKALKKYPNSIEKDKFLFNIGDATIRSGDEKRGKKILAFLLKKYPDGPYAQQAKALVSAPARASSGKKEKKKVEVPAQNTQSNSEGLY